MAMRALLSWSSGKDSAWTLHVLRERGDVDVVGLVTTVDEHENRVPMHRVRAALLAAQAEAAGLPLWRVPLPTPCPDHEYERRMRALIESARAERVEAFAFGDLFLGDIRAYREHQLAGTGLAPLFPLWGTPADTPGLARTMIAAGVGAALTCVDLRELDASFAGRALDERLLAELPAGVDPCGERGEFHTFCHRGPMFARPIGFALGPIHERDGYAYADLTPASTPAHSTRT